MKIAVRWEGWYLKLGKTDLAHVYSLVSSTKYFVKVGEINLGGTFDTSEEAKAAAEQYLNVQPDRPAELEKELAVYKRALELCSEMLDRITAAKGWREVYLTKAREELG